MFTSMACIKSYVKDTFRFLIIQFGMDRVPLYNKSDQVQGCGVGVSDIFDRRMEREREREREKEKMKGRERQ